MRDISRRELQHLLASGPVQLVEISPAEEYCDFHLPRAINVPMDRHFEVQIRRRLPDKSHPIVVYSIDADCQDSPKAVQHLIHLGYTNVYHYEAGKVDWQAAGLPIHTDSDWSHA